MKEILEKTGLAPDEEIIKKILRGEQAFFEILIRRNNPLLYKVGRSFGFNHQDTEDLMQDTHVAAYLQLGSFENRSGYKTWLCKIMVNKCIYKMRYGYYSREKPESSNIADNSQPLMMPKNKEADQLLLNKELSGILEFGVQQLPVNYRTVFILREVEGFNVAETAELLQITPINVKVRLNRAKALLQKSLEQVYSSSGLYEFNLVYCDPIVEKIFQKINSIQKK